MHVVESFRKCPCQVKHGPPFGHLSGIADHGQLSINSFVNLGIIIRPEWLWPIEDLSFHNLDRHMDRVI
jgi:hypothetical protein